MLSIVETRPSDWKYVSEGGATIVFSYVGPLKPSFDGTVLRLRKTAILPSESVVNAVEGEPDDPSIAFQTRCMTKLIPKEHLPRLESILLERAWLSELHQLSDEQRPHGRRQKDSIDLSRQKGVLATDLVGGDWLAVEIKPKWGFLPNTRHLSKETRDIKANTCRFCMHSRVKAKSGSTASVGYCPLDLFSGDELGIANAINCLWDAWVESDGTVNNLKIFAKGRIVRPSEAHLLSGGSHTSLSNEDLQKRFTASLTRPLLLTPVLSKLGELQRSLDILDIEGLCSLKHPEEEFPLLQDLSISEWEAFLALYLFRSSSAQPDNGNPERDDILYYLHAYLLSATFKDCSIIVRLDFLGADALPQDVKPENVVVIDLDPKSVRKLKDWVQLDKKIVTEYASVENKKKCIATVAR